MTVSGGVFSEVFMAVLGCVFMALSMAKGLTIGRTSPPMPASPMFRVLLFLVGLFVFIQGVRLIILLPVR